MKICIRRIAPGGNDLKDWLGKPRPLALQISSSRHGHQLVTRHPNGEFFPIDSGRIAGVTSAPPGLPVWYQSYHYFDAAAVARSEMPWYVEDNDTGERTGPNPTNATLINWIAAPAPKGLSGALTAQHTVNLQWDRNGASPDGAFVLESRLDNDPAWQAVGAPMLVSDVTDANGIARKTTGLLVFNQTYHFRVRHTFGSNPSRQSAPSNMATVIVLDDDDDGIPNVQNPDANDDDSDDDGIPDGEDGSGDTDTDGIPDWLDPDSDNDGVGDGEDKFPKDKRRSDYIPVKYYGVIDFSQGLTPPMPVNASLKAITIDDTNRVAFATVSPTEMRSVVWDAGTIQRDDTTPTMGLQTLPSPYLIDTYPFDVVGISPEGTVRGNVDVSIDTNVSPYPPNIDFSGGSYPAGFKFENGALTVTPPGPGWTAYDPWPRDPDPPAARALFVGPSGRTLYEHYETGQTFRLKWGTWQLAPGTVGWGVAASSGNHLLWQTTDGSGNISLHLLDGSTNTDEMINIPGTCNAINDQKQVVGSLKRWISNQIPPDYGHWEGYENPAHDFPDGTNADGSTKTRKGRGELGFFWQPGMNEPVVFHDLLPEKKRNQIRSAIPYAVIDLHPEESNPVIYLTAECLEGPPENPVWLPRKLVWRKASSTEEAVVATQMRKILPSGQEVNIPDVPAWAETAVAVAKDDASNFGLPPAPIPAALLPVDIVPDFNRDGVIDDKDRGKVTEQEPWRWWINDDDDSGTTSGDDIPLAGTSGSLDWNNDTVDGIRDLVDWFPLFFDIKQMLEVLPPSLGGASGGATYKLKQEDGALNVVFTDLNPGNVRDFLTKLDGSGNLIHNAVALSSAQSRHITSGGVELETFWLNKIKNEGRGVVLLESRKTSDKPLVLEVSNNGQKVAEVKFHVKFDGVEKMYRWVNLRAAANNGAVGRATDTGEPSNRPDRLTTDKHFVLVHGYNVNEEQARGWFAETFKRLYQAGLRAKFTGVTWRGDQGQFPGVKITPDYWENVTNAFTTSPALASAVGGLSGTKVIAGHSLGNMVVTSAIKDHTLSVSKYFMLDAAVAMEAYDQAAREVENMRHPDWVDAQGVYSDHLWASDWYLIFPDGDGRRKLAWNNRFGLLPTAYNFFSSGEEVLNNTTNGAHNNTLWENLVSQQANRAWISQELVKGRWQQGTFGWVQQGGWDFNQAHFVQEPGGIGGATYRRKSSSEANAIPNSVLRTEPFFRRFADQRLMNDSQGSAAANEYHTRAKTLAEGVPAISFAAGRNDINGFGNVRNFDLMDLRSKLNNQPQWPRADGAWHHSDAREVAFTYIYELFDTWIDLGGLK